MRKPEKQRNKQGFPEPMNCIFFEIHGSKLKLDPFSDLSQASILSISHCMLLFSISKYSLYCFFPLLVYLLYVRCMPVILGKFYVVIPNVDSYYLQVFLWLQVMTVCHHRRYFYLSKAFCIFVISLIAQSRALF